MWANLSLAEVHQALQEPLNDNSLVDTGVSYQLDLEVILQLKIGSIGNRGISIQLSLWFLIGGEVDPL
jgi:hypothetical protein